MEDLEAGVDGDGRDTEEYIRGEAESEETDDGGDSRGGGGGGFSVLGGGNASCGKVNDLDADLASLLLLRASRLLFLLPFCDQ